MSDEKEQAKPNPQVSHDRFKTMEQVSISYRIVAEAGLTREQMTHPDFFGQIAQYLRPYNRIELLSDDGSFVAELIVLAAERTFARVHVLHWHDLTTKDVAKTQAAVSDRDPAKLYRIEHRGAHLKHCVIRNSDGAVIREKEESKTSAQKWLDEYASVTA